MKKRIDPPQGALRILSMLEKQGHEAYVVGGCVRDSLLGLVPKDWDICTSALPEEVLGVFSADRVIPTGIKHGTVTVITEDRSYEITTYRTEGSYTDHRRPDNVTFVRSLREDLSRRDFTVNAMAYSPTRGLVDYHGGREDLKSNLIRCVGEPRKRFEEDALRMLRALRFASNYRFTIDADTGEAIHACAQLLDHIAAERIASELHSLLMGEGVAEVLIEYSDVICRMIPELSPTVGFDQKSRYHCYTVYEHIARACGEDPGKDPVTRLALLLHDVGKPLCYSEDENGGHFYGHAEISCQLARVALERLKLDHATCRDVLELIRVHDMPMEENTMWIKRRLSRLGEKQMNRLIDLHVADAMAQSEDLRQGRTMQCERIRTLLHQIIEQQPCLSLGQLAVGGKDLLALGIPKGPRIGKILETLLRAVIEEEVENRADELIALAKQIEGEANQS